MPPVASPQPRSFPRRSWRTGHTAKLQLPVPDSEMDCEVPSPLLPSSVMVTLAVRVPVADGVKVTPIEQEAPGVSVDPQVVICAKSVLFGPPTAILEMRSEERRVGK